MADENAVVVSREVDGIKIPEGIDVELVRSLASDLEKIAEEGRRADKVIIGRKQTVADLMLAVARKAGSREVFNIAYSVEVARYKARHGKGAMPKVYTQTASDIRRMFDQRVDMGAKGDDGLPLSYNSLRAKAAKAIRSQQYKIKEAQEKAKPDYLKTFEGLVHTIRGFADTRGPDAGEHPYLAECPPIAEVNEVMAQAIEGWLKDHPEYRSKEEREELEEETRLQGETSEEAEPARAAG